MYTQTNVLSYCSTVKKSMFLRRNLIHHNRKEEMAPTLQVFEGYFRHHVEFKSTIIS